MGSWVRSCGTEQLPLRTILSNSRGVEVIHASLVFRRTGDAAEIGTTPLEA